ncbi:MAG: cytochrome d ubiquinol oxidase subunit II [Paracoccaceae bacterium]
MNAVFSDPATQLPWIFAALMGLSILIYVILDGFDLGVGILMPLATDAEKDRMVASIGPFWDANETWLVLAVGILLVAFPAAHGLILTSLYLPVAIMLLGLILRGVAFEFRVKAPARYKAGWNTAFFAGSILTALSQGFMLGMYIMGLEWTLGNVVFSLLCAGAITVGYSFIGACWLVHKCEKDLQIKAVAWARRGILGAVVGIGLVSLATPLVSPRIFDKWFEFPAALYLAPLPVFSAMLVAALWSTLGRMPYPRDRWNWLPFALATGLFLLAFLGMAYSFYPYVVPERLTIYESASAPESLFIIFVGTCVVLPTIIGYTVLAYTIFRGKARDLTYD